MAGRKVVEDTNSLPYVNFVDPYLRNSYRIWRCRRSLKWPLFESLVPIAFPKAFSGAFAFDNFQDSLTCLLGRSLERCVEQPHHVVVSAPCLRPCVAEMDSG
jgi:hypothetical protein